jgi:hypothetical protein
MLKHRVKDVIVPVLLSWIDNLPYFFPFLCYCKYLVNISCDLYKILGL